LNNAVELHIKHGYSVNFYKIKEDVFMEVTNREGIIVCDKQLTFEKIEELKSIL
jgi:hypothetical protein